MGGGVGVQGSGRLDLDPVSGAVICFRSVFRGVVASDCVRCVRGEGDQAREALWFDHVMRPFCRVRQ
jgi:hypothetical protein